MKTDNANAPSSQSICRFFYGKKPTTHDPTLWKCTCGVQRRCDVTKHGYANLMDHVKKKHPDYIAIYKAHALETSLQTSLPSLSTTSSVNSQSTIDYMIDAKSRSVYQWLEWIVMDEHELQFCEKKLTRENSNLPKICARTLKKHLFNLVDAVEKKITTLANAASNYALIFNGWTEHNTHFVGKGFTVLHKV
jgi:hypothetical protein